MSQTARAQFCEHKEKTWLATCLDPFKQTFRHRAIGKECRRCISIVTRAIPLLEQGFSSYTIPLKGKS